MCLSVTHTQRASNSVVNCLWRGILSFSRTKVQIAVFFLILVGQYHFVKVNNHKNRAENIITARKRSLGQGNIFSSVCQEFCSWGGVYLSGIPSPPEADPPSRAQTSPPTVQCMLGDTGMQSCSFLKTASFKKKIFEK